MKRRVASIIALFYSFGAVGIAVAAYNCIDCGVTGVVTYSATSPKSCYVESCCDDEQNTQNIRIDTGLPCCDVSAQAAPGHDRVLLPDPTNAHPELPAETRAPVDHSRPDARIAVRPLAPSTSRASIDLPLLI